MKRQSYKTYILLALALFLLASLPAFFVEKLRAGMMGLHAWLFHGVTYLRETKGNDSDRLEGENQLLRMEVVKLRTLLEQREKMANLYHDLQIPGLSPKRCDEITYLSEIVCQSIPARVIYRDPGNRSSTLWVSVGEETNRILGQAIVQKNSPVILGRSVVGAVDYVGHKQSRVRLISDIAMCPSVRAARGYQQNVILLESIDFILRHLNVKNDRLFSQLEKSHIKTLLESAKEKISTDHASWYLAKGVLHGASTPLGRSVNHTLRGIGFNYDFSDVEGPARELTTGKIVESEEILPAMAIIQESDILVTTGMDGVFPPGFRVAEVTKIFPLREGAYTYEIEAVPIVGNLDTLQTVFIIPPIGYCPET